MRSQVRVSTPPASRRRGAIAVLFALLLLPLLGFTAFCVDVGWITATKSELQNAADASALAGANQLMDNYSAYLLPAQSNRAGLVSGARSSANTYSRNYGQYNAAGDAKSLTILPGDIQVGFTDASGTFTAGASGYPNTVQVLIRRDASANNKLPLFFARVLGTRDTSLTATSSATVYSGLITSFDPNGGGEDSSSGDGFTSGGGDGYGEDYGSSGSGFQCLLLPVALDINDWNNFLSSGVSRDGRTYSDASGAAQIQVYPSPHQAPGNFGMLNIGPYTNSDSVYANWIQNGPSASDLAYLINDRKYPVSQASPKAWKGSPGLRSGLADSFQSIMGQPRLLPLFRAASTTPYQAASGAGSNATYDIVGFVGVSVSHVTGRGGNLQVFVRPCDVIDPTAVFDPSTMYPVGAEPASQLKAFTHPAPKITR